MGGGALGSNYVSKLGSKEVSKKLRNLIPRPYDGRGCHEVTGEGESQIAQSLQEDPFCTKSIDFGKRRQVRDDKLRHPELVSGSQMQERGAFSRKIAFTLAEVLITIGIIGIVAALTLPSVINKYKAKQLETAFKKSSSIITSALNDTLFEFGLKELSFKELCDGYSDPMACYQANSEFFEQINNYFLSRFIVQKKITDTMYNQLNRETILVTNYTGNKKTFGYGQQYGMNAGNTPWHSVNFLSDGSVISALAFFYHGASDGVSLTFDTNGPYRGPNR